MGRLDGVAIALGFGAGGSSHVLMTAGAVGVVA
jgi:hypothetical protein